MARTRSSGQTSSRSSSSCRLSGSCLATKSCSDSIASDSVSMSTPVVVGATAWSGAVMTVSLRRPADPGSPRGTEIHRASVLSVPTAVRHRSLAGGESRTNPGPPVAAGQTRRRRGAGGFMCVRDRRSRPLRALPGDRAGPAGSARPAWSIGIPAPTATDARPQPRYEPAREPRPGPYQRSRTPTVRARKRPLPSWTTGMSHAGRWPAPLQERPQKVKGARVGCVSGVSGSWDKPGSVKAA